MDDGAPKWANIEVRTVGELIDLLKKYPLEMKVEFPACLLDGCTGYVDREEVHNSILYLYTGFASDWDW
jgi:hypothetical protein